MCLFIDCRLNLICGGYTVYQVGLVIDRSTLASNALGLLSWISFFSSASLERDVWILYISQERS